MPEHLTIQERDDIALASVMARKSMSAAKIGTALGMSLLDRPAACGSGAVTFIGTGPGTWLAFHDGTAPDFAADLTHRLAGLASVSDQSSGYVVLRLAGEGARKLLQRGAAIDFHPASFSSGSVATTVIAHIGVVIRQVDDGPTYDVATFRSFAGSLREWIDHAAAALAF